MLIYDIVYTDFDGSTKEHQVKIVEPSEGEFYALDTCTGVNNPPGTKTLGCSKTMSSVVHWKPIRAAITDLLGGRTLVSYKEHKPC